MKIVSQRAIFYLFGVASIALVAGEGLAQTAAAPGKNQEALNGIADIVVTAQKRSESLRNVGMAITAASGIQLKQQGITGLNGLTKLDSSFATQNTAYGAPVYLIRGVGFNDFSIAATPTVSVYQDEVPFAYTSMTKGASFDLERVEVLKGPQGTLYGQSSTAGAVNYIAAKPTSTFAAGLEGTYASYGAKNLNGYMSGPVTDTLLVRLAFDLDRGGAWQKSTTREAELGDKRNQKVRLLAKWSPTDRLTINLNLSAWSDHSDTMAGQLTSIVPSNAKFVTSIPGLLSSPAAPNDPRAADWWFGIEPRNHEQFLGASLRSEYKLSDDVTLTYVGSYQHFKQNDTFDYAGVDVPFFQNQAGTVRATSQEARISGKAFDNKLIWVVGGNYDNDHVDENSLQTLLGSTSSFGFYSYYKAAGITPIPQSAVLNVSTNKLVAKAGFANLEYHPSSKLNFHAGLRYTSTDITHGGCTKDVGGTSYIGSNVLQKLIRSAVGGTYVPAVANGCTTFDADYHPAYIRQSLDQSNVSWRAGIDWKPIPGTLLYATISKGYKAGSFPTLSATSYIQLKPVTEESLLAYEVGAKSRLLNGLLYIEGDLFYYDYKNKQLQGRIVDPNGVFSALNALVNIPKAYEDGAELNVQLRPVRKFLLGVKTTYLHSKILGDTPGFDGFGVPTNFEGQPFPNTPRWSILADARYDFDLSQNLTAFVDGNIRYRSGTQALLATEGYVSGIYSSPPLHINSYSLIGLRAGIATRDERWRIEVFADNVTNKYYITQANRAADESYRLAGMPRTVGLTIGYKY